MNALDIILILVGIIAFVSGCRKGLLRAAGGIVGVVVSLYLAKGFSHLVSPWLLDCLPEADNRLVVVLAFLCVFIVSYIVISLLVRLLESIVSAILLGWANRLLGGFASLLVGIFLSSVVLNAIVLIDKDKQVLKQSTREGSILYESVVSFAPALFPMLKPSSWFEEASSPTTHSQLLHSARM